MKNDIIFLGKMYLLFPHTLGNVDYTELTNMAVIFNAGINTQTVALTTLSDQLIEGDEELRATLVASTNNIDAGRIDITVSEATVTITEDIGM